MRQFSNRSDAQLGNAMPMDPIAGSVTSHRHSKIPLYSDPRRSLNAQLHYEQTLNHFIEQCQLWLESDLAQGNSPEPLSSRLPLSDVELLNTLALALSQGLGGGQVAIARLDASTHQIYLQFIAPSVPESPAEQTPEGPLTWCHAAIPQGVTIGHSFTAQEVQALQQDYPPVMWPLSDTWHHWGWVLVSPADPAWVEPCGNPDRDRAHFIERSIQQCLYTLRHWQQLQRVQQHHQLLVEKIEELEQTNRLKSEFLANTSHEIRTPLSAILGFAQILRDQGWSGDHPRQQEYLQIIAASGHHLLTLINDILDLSKIEANQLDMYWETVYIRDMCEIVLTLVREKAAHQGLMLALTVELVIDTLVADPLRLKQMLVNLLSNALKFTKTGTVGLKVHLEGDWVHFTVWDTGPGIAPEQQALLFQPYLQLPQSGLDRESGTGLGLALTQKLAELHGGWVEVRSHLKEGSQFTIVLPLVPTTLDQGIQLTAIAQTNRRPEERTASDQGLQPTATPMPEPSRAPKHLLLVEDNIHNAKLLLIYLNKLGYQVTWAKYGAEMWAALERTQPHLILMDIHLPEVDGLTLIRQLRAHPAYQSMPIIAQTALAMMGDRAACLEAGADDYISKPIDLKGLALLIERYLVPS